MKSVELAGTACGLHKAMEYSASNFLANWRVDYSTAVSGNYSAMIYTSLRSTLWGATLLYVYTIQYNECAMTTPPNFPIVDNTNLAPSIIAQNGEQGRGEVWYLH